MTPLNQKLDSLTRLILMSVLIASPFLGGAVGIFAVTIIELAAFFILYLWALKSLENGRLQIPALPLNKYIALFFLFIIIQCLFAGFFVRGFSLGSVYQYKIGREILITASYAVFFYAVLMNFKERRKINRLIACLTVAAFSLSVFGIVGKLCSPAGGTFATFPNRNHFANYINMAAFLALGQVFTRFPFLGFNIKGLVAAFQKGIWLYMFSLVIMLSGVAYSLSRGGLLSLCCALVLFSALILAKNFSRRGYIFFIAILIFAAMMIAWIGAPQRIMDRLSSMERAKGTLTERVLESRALFAEWAVAMAKDRPVFGVGFGAIRFIYNKIYVPDGLFAERRVYIDHIHNDFLELLCEVGLAGFLIILLIVGSYVFLAFKILWARKDPYVIGLSAGAMAALFSMCVHSFFEFNFHVPSNAILFFSIAGLLLAAVNSQMREGSERTLLPEKTLRIKSPVVKNAAVITASAFFCYACVVIIRPYMADVVARDRGVISLKKAARLDPANDKYHFLLAEAFIKMAKTPSASRRVYVQEALREMDEAIKMDPWNRYYGVYVGWIKEHFSS